MVAITNKPETFTDRYVRRGEALNRMYAWLKQDIDEWNRLEHMRFLDAYGCERCLGRGWIVTWDTMDCMDGSCAEYGKCPEETCTEESRKASGLDLSKSLLHDHWKNVFTAGLREADPSWVAKVSPLERAIGVLGRKRDLIRAFCEPKKGDKVVIVRGRPKDRLGDVMPVGSISFVAYAKEGRCLLKLDWEDRGADGTWTASHNLEVIVPEGK